MKNFLKTFAMLATVIASLGLASCETETDSTESEPTYYTVSFNSDGGSSVASQTVESGKTAVEPKSPTKASTETATYTFAGWYNGTNPFDFTTPITADITLTAHWTETAITPTPQNSDNDAENSGDAQEDAKDETNTDTQNPDGTGGNNPDGTGGNNPDTMPETPKTYTVIFNLNDGSETPETKTQIFAENKAASLTSVNVLGFARTGYVFSAWNTAKDGSGTVYADGAEVSVSANLILYAQWALVPPSSETGTLQFAFIISDTNAMKKAAVALYDKTTGEVIAGFSPEVFSITSDSVAYSKTSVPTGTYRLKAFFYADDEQSLCVASVQELVTILTGNQTVITREISADSSIYTITYDLKGGSWADNFSPISQFTKYSGDLLLPTENDAYLSGYYFDGWYTEESFAGEKRSVLTDTTQSITLYAKWSEDCRVYAARLSETDFSDAVFTKNNLIKLAGEWTAADISALGKILYGSYFSYSYAIDMSEATGITEIPENAFSGELRKDTKITEIILPETVESIGDYAFANTTLKEINLPASLKSIGSRAFASSLVENVVIPNGITEITVALFSGCTELKSVTIPASVTSIGGGAFSNCKSLKTVALPKGITSIAQSLFTDCESLESIVIPEGVTTINDWAFIRCKSLKSANIPSTVTKLGYRCFQDCESLTTLTISKDAKITDIPEYCFYRCKIENIVIPKTVKTISQWAFYACKFTEVELPQGLESIGQFAFDGILVTSLTIPSSVTEIGNDAFRECNKLETVIFSNTLKTIASAFYDTKKLTTVKFNGTLEEWLSYPVSSRKYLCDAGADLYLNGTKLTTVEIPSTVNALEDYMFYGIKSITSVSIPDSVTSIGKECFYSCENLKTISFSNSVKTIGNYAFNKTGITTVQYGGSLENWLSLSFVSETANPCNNGASLYLNGTLLTEGIVPASVTSVGNYALYGCASLSKITFSASSISGIGQKAFYNCSNLSEIHAELLSKTDWEAVEKGTDWATGVASGAKVYVSDSGEIAL